MNKRVKRAKSATKSVRRVEKATRLAARSVRRTSRAAKKVTRESTKRPYQHSAIKQPTWQNPLIEYVDAATRRRKRLHRKPPRRVRLERQILAMLAFFSISTGLWENFRQLWLQSNGFSVASIGSLVSLGMILGIVGVVIAGRYVKMTRVKRFMTAALVISAINLLALFFMNQTGQHAFIDVGIAIDVITSSLVVSSVYPLLTTVMKSNRTYSRRKLVEYLFRDIGTLIGGILIGRTIGNFVVDYNICLLIAAVFSVAAAATLYRTNVTMTESSPASRFSVVKFLLHNKLQRAYMIYVFVGGITYTAVVGLQMLIATDAFGLSAGMATTYLLLTGLAADALGILALRYFTPKNDYFAIIIKFGTRFLIFAAAFLSGDPFVCFIALTWTILSATSYENITDGYYINAIDNRHQLKYNTTKHVINTAGNAIGMFICGQMFELGLHYIFGISALLLIVQIATAFYLINLRHKKRTKRG